MNAPFPNRLALRAGNRNSLVRRRRTAASSDWALPFCERGVPHFTHSPRSGRQRTSSLPSVFPAYSEGNALSSIRATAERRSPAGIAPRSGAKPQIAEGDKARGRLGTPTSGRHSPPPAGGTAYRHSAGWRSRPGTPVFRLAQRPVGLRRRRPRSSEWLPSRHAPQMALPARERHRGQRGSRREGNHPGTGGPSRRPPAAGCADQRSAFQAVPAIFRRRLYTLGGLPAATQCSTSQRSGHSPVGIRTSTDREPAAKPVAGSRNRLPLTSRQSERPWP